MFVCLLKLGFGLKEFFHSSAYAQVLRNFNLCSGPGPEQSQFLRFYTVKCRK